MDRAFLSGEPGYPDRLLALPRPPPVVYVRGPLPELSPSVAIVGARRASELGRAIAERWARALSSQGVTIVSGGAIGVDAAAHAGAIAGGRPTLVVLPTPLESPSPVSNRRLFDSVLAAGGAWLSEYEGPVKRHFFCARNRLMAALVDLVVVVEAGAASGTRYTVAAARRLGRPIAAVPWALGDPGGLGCLAVLSIGGSPVTSTNDVLKLLGKKPALERARRARRSDRARARDPVAGGDLAARIEARLSEEECTTEELARDLNVEASALLTAFTMLEIEGRVLIKNGRAALVLDR